MTDRPITELNFNEAYIDKIADRMIEKLREAKYKLEEEE